MIYAHENGCEWDEKTIRAALDGKHVECLWYAYSNCCPTTEKLSPNVQGAVRELHRARQDLVVLLAVAHRNDDGEISARELTRLLREYKAAYDSVKEMCVGKEEDRDEDERD